jgi:type I restriction enzyme S subunit
MWSEISLGDTAEVSWGNTSTTKKAYVAEGYRAYSASGPDGFVDWAEHDEPGVVLSAIGAQCGKTWWAEGAWTSIKNTIWFRSNSPDVDSRFLYYATADPDIWPKRGAAQPFISQGDARALKLRLPPLEHQLVIVGVLSTFDDLIENNRGSSLYQVGLVRRGGLTGGRSFR